MVGSDTITSETRPPRAVDATPTGGYRSHAWERGIRLVAWPVRFVAFWAAVSLPFLYVPLLFDGLGSGETVIFLQLLCLNAVALVVGHGYGRD